MARLGASLPVGWLTALLVLVSIVAGRAAEPPLAITPEFVSASLAGHLAVLRDPGMALVPRRCRVGSGGRHVRANAGLAQPRADRGCRMAALLAGRHHRVADAGLSRLAASGPRLGDGLCPDQPIATIGRRLYHRQAGGPCPGRRPAKCSAHLDRARRPRRRARAGDLICGSNRPASWRCGLRCAARPI